ncbi:hypothetical protein GFS31_37150 [Leptolyngbya sp. BL0902]|uniref:hypothetical protein n=1 Tax=Leptolyngbya sp. BL0902 TaxID=1115757 RepID=UPI0018E7D137|nr:hypothetical protein [Leptolyngbya sp. BL0902]QQE67009.1 hypothetical protein GFS31_37150 [Leptolyngbya sp. BL0902]
MLCRSCQNQDRCLPAQFALADPALADLLNQLQSCQLQNSAHAAVSPPPSPLGSIWVRGQRWGQQVWQSFHHWAQNHWIQRHWAR